MLRFPSSIESPLSSEGKTIISSTPELCYLTQIVIRLFENTDKREDDPTRFRIEILFSPGATATPLHMSTSNRNSDRSRNDTEPLQLVSKKNLTCAEVEEYFDESMKEGNNEDDDNRSNISTVNCPLAVKEIMKEEANPDVDSDVLKDAFGCKDATTPPKNNKKQKFVTIDEEKNTEFEPAQSTENGDDTDTGENQNDGNEVDGNDVSDTTDTEYNNSTSVEMNASEAEDKKKIEIERMAKILAKQYLWSAAAVTSFCLGIGFLFLATSIHNDSKSRRFPRRR